MSNNSKARAIIFSVYILLSFYVFGGGIVNSLVSYPTWREVGVNEFPEFHQVDSGLIIPLFVVLFFLSFIPQILLLWFRPAVISKQLVILALFLNLIVLVSTIIIQIPIQKELDIAYSLPLINKLIHTDFLYRKIPMFILTAVNFIMLFKVIRRAEN